MADKSSKKAEAPAEEQAPPARKKGKLMLIAGLAVVLLASGGGGAWYFLMRSNDAHATQAAKPQPPKPPIFINLEPFTVNLQPEESEQYLQVVATLKLDDNKAADALKVYMPEVRHKILLLLSGKKPSEISTPTGREQLALEIRQATNLVVAASTGQPLEAAAAPAEAHAEAKQAVEGQAPAEAQAKAGEPEKASAVAATPPAITGPILGVLFTSFIIQ